MKGIEKRNVDSPMINWLYRQFVPNGIIAIIENHSQLTQLQKYPLFNGINLRKQNENESEYAIICRNFACSLPIYSIQELERHVRKDS